MRLKVSLKLGPLNLLTEFYSVIKSILLLSDLLKEKVDCKHEKAPFFFLMEQSNTTDKMWVESADLVHFGLYHYFLNQTWSVLIH